MSFPKNYVLATIAASPCAAVRMMMVDTKPLPLEELPTNITEEAPVAPSKQAWRPKSRPVSPVVMPDFEDAYTYDFKRPLAWGAEAEVFKLTSTKDPSESLVLKLFQRQADAEAEIAAFQTLGDHPNVIKLVASDNGTGPVGDWPQDVSKKSPSIVLPFANEGAMGDLEQGDAVGACMLTKFQKRRTAILEKKSLVSATEDALGVESVPEFVASVFQQIVQGLNFLHQQNFVHGDFKNENILVNSKESCGDKSYTAFVADISGLAQSPREMPENTLRTRAPELFRPDAMLDTKAEAWALGVALYEFMYVIADPELPRFQEFYTREEGEMLDKASLKHEPFPLGQEMIDEKLDLLAAQLSKFGDGFDKVLISLRTLLQVNPDERWGTDQVLKYLQE